MNARTSYSVTISDSPAEKGPEFQTTYPVPLINRRFLNLPLRPLPSEIEGIALLMSNQTPFVVEKELGSLLTDLALQFSPEVIVGIPTLGLDYARLVAQGLGFEDYVALGTSRKFWYDDEFSVPVHSVTSPGVTKKLYLDPALVERVKGKRTLIIDDVINTGGSAVAAVELLQRAGALVLGLAVVLIEGEAWKQELIPFAADWPERVKGVGFIPIFRRTEDVWCAI